ncbi:MAG: ABC transporter substrate-binding protein [bacterium]
MDIKKVCKTMWIFSFCFLLMGGCTKKSDRKETRLSQNMKKQDQSLMLFNWENYIGAETLENFEKETGIHVKEVNFKDEEEMLGVIQSHQGEFDLVVVSDDMVREMTAAKLLAKLDYSKIPNFENIGEQYINRSFDPNQTYSVPYLIGTSGMVINRKYINKNMDSWKVLWDKRYQGRLAMLNNPFEVVGVACKLLGYDLNTKDYKELARAKEMLFEQKSLLTGYHDVVTIQNLMRDETLWAAQIYSGDGLVLTDENEDIEYIIPKEGAPVWMDVFVMPRDAKHKEEAHIFLDYILRPDVMAAIASEYWYATPNKAAEPFMDQEVLDSPSVYPSREVLACCEFFDNSGPATRFIQSIWSDLLTKE